MSGTESGERPTTIMRGQVSGGVFVPTSGWEPLGFDVTREIARSISSQRAAISAAAQRAVDRLYWMHAVGSGICGCGGGIHDHPLWDDHSPTELPIDKSACQHETFSSMSIGDGLVRMTCDDCGETSEMLSATARADLEEWSSR